MMRIRMNSEAVEKLHREMRWQNLETIDFWKDDDGVLWVQCPGCRERRLGKLEEKQVTVTVLTTL